MKNVGAAENISTSKLEVSGGDVAVAGCQYNEHWVIAYAVVFSSYARDDSGTIDEVNSCVAAEAKCLSSNINVEDKNEVTFLSSNADDKKEVTYRDVVSSYGFNNLPSCFEDNNVEKVGGADRVVDTCGSIATNLSYLINQSTILGDNNRGIKLDMCNGIPLKFWRHFVGNITTCTDKICPTKASKVKLGRYSFPGRRIGEIVGGAAEFSSKSKVISGEADSTVEESPRRLIVECNLIYHDSDEHRNQQKM